MVNKVWVVVSKDLRRNTIDLREKKAGRTRTEVTPKDDFKRNESVKTKGNNNKNTNNHHQKQAGGKKKLPLEQTRRTKTTLAHIETRGISTTGRTRRKQALRNSLSLEDAESQSCNSLF